MGLDAKAAQVAPHLNWASLDLGLDDRDGDDPLEAWTTRDARRFDARGRWVAEGGSWSAELRFEDVPTGDGRRILATGAHRPRPQDTSAVLIELVSGPVRNSR